MSIIQEKITSGALILYHDYRSGSMLDWSGNSQDGVANNTVPFTKNGLMLNRVLGSNNGYVSVPSNLGITGAISVVSVMTPNNAPDGIGSTIANVYDYSGGSDNGWLFGDTYGSDDHFQFTIWNAGSNGVANYNSFWANHKGQRVCVAGTYEPSTAIRLYVDSIEKATDTISVPASLALPDTETFRVGLRSDDNGAPYDSGAWDGQIECVLVFNETLTATEVAQVTAELKAKNWPTKPISKTVNKKLQQSSDLTSHWIMEPQGDTIVDETGAGNDASVIGSPTFVNTLLGPGVLLVDNLNRFDTGSDWVGTGALTFGCWIKLDGYGNANAGRIFENGKTLLRFEGANTRLVFSSDGSTGVTSATGSIPLNRLTFISVTRNASGVTNFYVDGVLSGSADQDSGTPVGGTNNVIFGNRNAGEKATEGTIVEPFAIVGTVETAAQILARYKLGAEQVQFKTDWGSYANQQTLSGGYISNTPWEIISGTWKTTTDTIEGQPCKVFETVSSGILVLDTRKIIDTTEAAYGTWEFWLYKGAEGNTSTVSIIDSDTTVWNVGGYGFRFMSDEKIQFIEWGVQEKFNTVASYIQINTWYNIKITRSEVGIFTSYIRGGAFGNNWTLINVTGGTGTNPFTDNTITASNYFVLDLDAGDKIAIADNAGNHSFVKKVGVV